METPNRNDDKIYSAFNAINNFLTALHNVFEKNKSIRAYKFLLDKTSISKKEHLLKHINAFLNFYENNQLSFREKSANNIVDKISYSDNVFLDIKGLLTSCKDDQIIDCIWNHLYTIIHIIKPESNCKTLISKTERDSEGADSEGVDSEGLDSEGKDEDEESSIIKQINDTLNSSLNNDKDISSIIQDGNIMGLIGNIQTGVQSGNVNPHKILQGVMNQISGNPEIKGMLSALAPMLGGMMQGNGGGMDIEKIFGMMESLDLNTGLAKAGSEKPLSEKPGLVKSVPMNLIEKKE
jgi:hypothetical protein